MKKGIMTVGAVGAIFATIIPLNGRALYCTKTIKEENSAIASSLGYKNNYNDLKEKLNITAKSAYVVEPNTNKVIFSYNENEKLAPASMTKIMTMLIVLEDINSGKLSLNDEVLISENASRQEGSKCFIDAGVTYLVKDLLKSVAVASANDSAVALSEHIAGTEANFSERMNKRAKELGMINTNFKNATGLDEEGHYTTAKDISIAINELAKYEKIIPGHNDWMYDIMHPSGRVTNLVNTNRLVRTEKDLVIAKTGHTDNAGYCLTTYSKRDGTTIIASVFGVSDSLGRFNQIKALNSYAFSAYETVKVADSSEAETSVTIKGGNEREVKLVPERDVFFTKPKGEEITILKEVIEETKDVVAPIEKGTPLAKLRIELTSGEEETVNLVSNEGIKKITYGEIYKKVLTDAK